MLHARQLNVTSHGSTLTGDTYANYQGYSVPICGPLPSREFCDKHNERLGEDRWREHIYSWQQYVRYMLFEDGTVWMEAESGVSEDRIRVTDETTVQRILTMQKEDRETLAARDEHARQIAAKHFADDKRARIALRCAIEYYPGRELPGEPSDDGIYFYDVGRNASHSFYMGLRLNSDETVTCFSAAVGPEPDKYPEDNFSYREVEEFTGYYGHL